MRHVFQSQAGPLLRLVVADEEVAFEASVQKSWKVGSNAYPQDDLEGEVRKLTAEFQAATKPL